MNGTKPWYQSTSIWGAVVALFASLGSLVHLHVSNDPNLANDLTNWLTSLATILGAGVALYGRIRATKQVQSSGVSAPKLVLVAVMLFGGGLFASCTAQTGTPTTQPAAVDATQVLTAANQSVALLQTILSDLHAAGVFSAGDWQNVVNAEQAIGAALDAWQANLNQPGAVQAQAAFEAALPTLLNFVHTGQARKSPPTTAPAVQPSLFWNVGWRGARGEGQGASRN